MYKCSFCGLSEGTEVIICDDCINKIKKNDKLQKLISNLSEVQVHIEQIRKQVSEPRRAAIEIKSLQLQAGKYALYWYNEDYKGLKEL